jgi:O-antigen ligase
LFIFYLPQLIEIFRKTKKKYLIIYLLFVLCLILGISTSENPLAGFYGLIKFFEFSFLAIYIYNNIKILNKTIIFYCISISIIFVSLLSFWQYLNQGAIGSLFYFFGERQYSLSTPGVANALINGQLVLRPYATFSHPNMLAGFLVTSILFLFIFFKNTSIEKILLVASLILGTISMLLSLSRLSILVWFFILLVFFCFSIYKKYKKGKSNIKHLTFLISGLTVSLYVLIFQNSVLMQRFLSTSLLDESIVQRENLLHQAIVMFEKNPVFGVGLNNFYNNLNPFTGKILLIQPVHNIFMLVLSETGVIGLIFLISILALGLARAIKLNSNKRKYIICLFLSVCLLGMFDHYFLTLQQGQLLFTLFLATTLSAKNIT